MKKKDIPLVILQVLEPYLSQISPLYKIVEDKDSLLKFKDTDPNSDFYFTVVKYETTTNAKNIIRLSIKPRSHSNINDWITDESDPASIKARFDGWVNSLQGYADVKSVFDEDPIERQYEKEIFSDYEIVDDDADTSTYDFKSQLLIDRYLENCKAALAAAKDTDNAKDVENIEREIDDVKKNQTKWTKRKVHERLVKIWAKVRKVSLPLFVEFMNEAKKELLKLAVKGAIELGKGVIQ